MTTKAELQTLCVDAVEAFLATHDIERRIREDLVDEHYVDGIEAGADVPFRTTFDVGTDGEGGLTVETRSTVADFAVWFATGRTYDELGDALDPNRSDSGASRVKIPLLVAEIVGSDYTQYHPISTSEMEFDEEGSPYVCRTNLPFLRHRLPTRLEQQGQLFVSDYDAELVPVRSNVTRLSSDEPIPDEIVRETVQIHLDEILRRLSRWEMDEHDPV
ncbi:hypothetical protein [Haloplanus salilacus]|uniref:hypothetical protein n=1 Tax=Haloplanus salilacus TaxID=2949994 RepID=UPI0030CB29DE